MANGESFKNGIWETEINVRDFIQKNYTPYDGDGSFLTKGYAPHDRIARKV